QQLDDVVSWLASQPGIEAEVIDRDEALAGGRAGRPETAADSADDASAAPVPPVEDGDVGHAPARVHSSWSITTHSAVEPQQLCDLVLDLPETVVRGKGILPDSRRPGCRFLVQYDGTSCETSEVAPDNETVADVSRIADGHTVADGLGARESAASDGAGRLVIIAAGDHPGPPEAVTSLAQALHGWVGG